MLIRPPEPRHSILIVDHHQLFLDAIEYELSKTKTWDVHCVQTVEAALDWLSEHGYADLVLLSYDLPGVASCDGLTRLLTAVPDLRVTYVAGNSTVAAVEGARDNGAVGFLTKDLSARFFKAQVTRLLSGLNAYVPKGFANVATDEGILETRLSEIQLAVLRQLLTGASNKEIAHFLQISVAMTKKHLRAIYSGLGVTNRTAAVLAVERGLIDADEERSTRQYSRA
jgi:DNA-binding NarL/FixJ family response regulator